MLMKNIGLFVILVAVLILPSQQKYQIIVKQVANLNNQIANLNNQTISKLVQKNHNITTPNNHTQPQPQHQPQPQPQPLKPKQTDNFEFQSVTMSNNDTVKQQIKTRLLQQQNAQMIRKQKTNKYLEQKLKEIEALSQMVKQVISKQDSQQQNVKRLLSIDFSKLVAKSLQANAQKMLDDNQKLKLENDKLKVQLIKIQEEKQQQNTQVKVLEQLYKQQQLKIMNLTSQQHKNETDNQHVNQQSFKQIEFASKLNIPSSNTSKGISLNQNQNISRTNNIASASNVTSNQQIVPIVNSFGDYRNMLNQQFGQTFRPTINPNINQQLNQIIYPNMNPEINQNINQAQYQQLTPEENYYYQNGLSQVQQAALDQLDFEDIAQDLS